VATVVGGLLAENYWYIHDARRAPDLLVADLIVLSAACLIARFRWPFLSFVASAGVPLLLALRHGFDGPTEVVMIACLMAVAFRSSAPVVTAAGLLGVGQFMLMTRWDPLDLQGDYPTATLVFGILIAAILVLRGIRVWIGRLRRISTAPDPRNTPRRDRSMSRPALAAGATVLIASQLGLLAYSQTFWPVNTSSSHFAQSFCTDFAGWHAVLVDDIKDLDHRQAGGVTVADRRDLHTAFVERVATQTDRLADRLQRLAQGEPTGSVERTLATGFGTYMRSAARKLYSLAAPWSALPTGSLAQFNAAQAPLKAQFADVGYSQSEQIDTMMLSAISTPAGSQRSFVHAVRATAGCNGLFGDE